MYKETLPEDIKMIIWAVAAIFIALAAFIIFFIFLFTQRKNKLIKEKILMEVRFQKELLQTQIEIQEQTLKTISQEIHDNIGQVLSLAKLQLNTFPASNDEQIRHVNDTKHLVSKAIVDLRNISRSMYGGLINDMGLPQAISNELTILKNTGQYETAIEVAGEPFKLPNQQEMIIFRMVQEAISNSIKHANAKKIIVKLKYHNDAFFLSVTDNGDGFDPQVSGKMKNGMGIKSMQNRAALIGGTFTLDSAVDKGTCISFEIANVKNEQ